MLEVRAHRIYIEQQKPLNNPNALNKMLFTVVKTFSLSFRLFDNMEQQEN